jgi:hypothetical protein
MPKSANWFTYFPDDYRWSSAVSGIIGSAPWGHDERQTLYAFLPRSHRAAVYRDTG